MAIGLRLHGITTVIGPGGVLHALFSTISLRLEPNGWGTRYPTLMHKLYQGHLDHEDAAKALDELLDVQEKLKAHAPSEVVWDIEDPAQPPPWGLEVGPHVKSLATYFVTSTGRDLLETLIENVECLKDVSGKLEIVSLPDSTEGAPRTG